MSDTPLMVTHDRAAEMTVHPIRSVERVTVTRIVTREGLGADKSCPVREVTTYYDDEGNLIGRYDPSVSGGDEGDGSNHE